jgi:hypothetical protein
MLSEGECLFVLAINCLAWLLSEGGEGRLAGWQQYERIKSK